MRKTLLATTAVAAAGAFAAGPALSADKASVGVGVSMQQWIGMSSVDATDKDGKATAVEGGVSQYPDAEVHFKGKLEADNGLTFSVKIELEGENRPGTGAIDESQLTVKGAFGQIVLGAEDGASTLTHHGNQDVGAGMNCGDVGRWIDGVGGCAGGGKMGLGTAGHAIDGDKNKISYYTPRVGGVQFGASYAPNTGQEGTGAAPKNNDADSVSVGINYVGDFGGANIAVSAGHFQASQVVPKQASEKLYAEDQPSGTQIDTVYTGLAYPGGNKIDDRTFTNFGLQVGFGEVGFDVAYAVNDGGLYKMNAAGDKIVKNMAADYEVVSAGVNYTDGPMAVSLGAMMADADDGSESSATMLSLAYTLAPGVVSKTSIFGAEQSSGANKVSTEGTAFVTGIVIGF